MKFARILAVLALAFLLNMPVSTGAQIYSETKIGTEEATTSWRAINNGYIAANSALLSPYMTTYMWLYKDGATTTVLPPPGFFALPSSVNSGGVVVGRLLSTTTFDPSRIFRWTIAGGFEDLTSIIGGVGGFATDINNLGDIVGMRYSMPGSEPEAFLLSSSGSVTILPSNGYTNHPYSINDNGTIVGTGGSDGNHGVIWTNPSSLEEIHGLSEAFAINNNGIVAGRSDNGAAIWQNGVVTYLAPGVTNSGAADINDTGQVVGNVNGAQAIWQNGVRRNLNDLLAPGSDPIAVVMGIDNSGNIIALTSNTGGLVLLQPSAIGVPEPGTVVFALTLACVIGGMRLRRRRTM